MAKLLPNLLSVLTGLIASFLSALVAWRTLRNARKLEQYRSYTAYLNVKLSTLLKAYSEYGGRVKVSLDTPEAAVKELEEQFNRCVAQIRVLRLFCEATQFDRLGLIEQRHSLMLIEELNAKQQQRTPRPFDRDAHAALLSEYITAGELLFQQEIRSTTKQLESIA